MSIVRITSRIPAAQGARRPWGYRDGHEAAESVYRLRPSFSISIAVLAGLLLSPPPALAARQDCLVITDRDQRNLCLADYDGKSTCTLIDDRDLRNYCRAKHGEGKGACVLIENELLRAKCRAELP